MEAETDTPLAEQRLSLAGKWRLLDNLDGPSMADLAMLMPSGADVQLQLARNFVFGSNLEKAKAAAFQAVRLAPDSPDTRAMAAALLLETGDPRASIEHLAVVTEKLPGWAEAWRMRAEAAFRLGDLTGAADALRYALHLRPDWPEASFRLAEVLLKLGDYPAGWALYESRWQCEDYVPLDSLSHIPRFEGHEPLQGRSIVIVAEQGMGDLIQYVRYAQLLRNQGATVIITCPSDLAGLLQSAPGIAAAIPFGMALPRVHYQVALLSLPRIFGTMIGSSRGAMPYLAPQKTSLATWRERINELALPNTRRVGVVWSGLTSHPYNPYRSIDLRQLQPLWEVSGISWFSLQKGPASARLLECDSPLIDVSAELYTFDDTAAAIEALDLVITVDTAVAHLCGALNHDGLLLLHTGCDYRWLAVGDRTPWYPSLHLFRQQEEGNWLPPLERAAMALQGWVAG